MKYHNFETLDSTNDHLAAMAEEGAREWTVVVADRQTSGRGRRNTDWWSPEGNLHLSILLRPDVTPRELMRLPVTASLALLDAMGEAGSPLRVKWPNDILLDGRKMAGILVESKSDGDIVRWAVAGFGVNMTRATGNIPVNIRNRIAFVHELDNTLEPNDMASRIVSGMKTWSGALTGDGWEIARARWTQRALLNVPYVFRDGAEKTMGKPIGLDANGGLVMETEDGEVTVYSGELGEAI